eukprot:scaffold30707_cov25-Tisochrysis_lutea.AAC.1
MGRPAHRIRHAQSWASPLVLPTLGKPLPSVNRTTVGPVAGQINRRKSRVIGDHLSNNSKEDSSHGRVPCKQDRAATRPKLGRRPKSRSETRRQCSQTRHPSDGNQALARPLPGSSLAEWEKDREKRRGEEGGGGGAEKGVVVMGGRGGRGRYSGVKPERGGGGRERKEGAREEGRARCGWQTSEEWEPFGEQRGELYSTLL